MRIQVAGECLWCLLFVLIGLFVIHLDACGGQAWQQPTPLETFIFLQQRLKIGAATLRVGLSMALAASTYRAISARSARSHTARSAAEGREAGSTMMSQTTEMT